MGETGATLLWAASSVGRARALHARGPGFNSPVVQTFDSLGDVVLKDRLPDGHQEHDLDLPVYKRRELRHLVSV